MLSLNDRLVCVEDDFLFALNGGEDAMSAFDHKWETLLEDIDDAIAKTTIETETLSLAYTISLRLAILADTSAEVYSNCESFTSQLIDEIDLMMSQLVITDLTFDPLSMKPSSQHEHSTSRKRRVRDSEGDDCLITHGRAKRRRSSHPDPQAIPTLSYTLQGGSIDDKLPTTMSGSKTLPTSPSKTRRVPFGSQRRMSSSDVDLSLATARPNHLCVGPRLHAVSDSFSVLLRSKPFIAAPIPALPLSEPGKTTFLDIGTLDIWSDPSCVPRDQFPQVDLSAAFEFDYTSALSHAESSPLPNLDIFSSLVDITSPIVSIPVPTSDEPASPASSRFTLSPASTPSRATTPILGPPYQQDPFVYQTGSSIFHDDILHVAFPGMIRDSIDDVNVYRGEDDPESLYWESAGSPTSWKTILDPLQGLDQFSPQRPITPLLLNCS